MLRLTTTLLLLLSLLSLSARTVVVLSMDAFRWDYPSKYHTPTLDSLGRAGVSAQFTPCFPSLTFPNHYSMATGLHPDHHGLVHNAFYDRELASGFRIADRQAVENPHFYGGEPIWVTAEKQGLRAATLFWVGSETKIQGRQPSDWHKYDGNLPFRSRADSVLSWMARPDSTRPDLIMWYIQEPDNISHGDTPDGPQTQAMVEELDQLLHYFFVEARQLPRFAECDFIVLADHGMSTYYPERYVNLGNYLPLERFTHLTAGPIVTLYPDADYLEEAYRILRTVPNISVWRKEEVPARYHYGKHPRVGELVVLANEGTTIDFRPTDAPRLGAAHGYDNSQPDMQAIFYAAGPSFKSGERHPALLNLNLYPLLCRLLKIEPAPNDGDPKSFEPMLR